MPDSATGLAELLPGVAAFPNSVIARDGNRVVIGLEPVEFVRQSGTDAFAAIDELTPGWWAGFLGYDLGRAVERVAPHTVDDLGLPDVLLARFDARLELDIVDGSARFVGSDASCMPLRRVLDGVGPRHAFSPVELGPPASSLDRDDYAARVERIVDHIEAGDCYQVNLTRRLAWDRPVDPFALFGALATQNPAPYSTVIRLDDLAVVSASPERFLRWDARAAETRPIKGTAADAPWLRSSAKDRAENVMIVDLARNDLGRVCVPGSIHVPSLCALESHPGLHHLVSTVRGTVRPEVSLATLLRATLPPASVTGAPKPRVMQIIEELEPVRRGVYCGAIGWLDTERNIGDLAVAIRTFTTSSDVTTLGVGAGIVADSDPIAEWEETELKAARLLRAAGASPRLAGARR